MHLIQILLPVSEKPNADQFREVRDELAEKFGGVTAFVQSPAEGLWKNPCANVDRDRIVLVEVMCDDLDRGWWKTYRKKLEDRFVQESVVIRCQSIVLL